jgi:hypothetical protein
MLKILLCALIISNLMVVGSYSQQDSIAESSQAHVVIRGLVKNAKLVPSQLPKESAVVLISLHVEIENEGDVPVLFLTDHLPGFPKLILTRDPEPLSDQNILFENYGGPTLSQEADWRALRKILDVSSPPPEEIQILGPHKSLKYDFDYVLRVPTRFGSYIIGGHPTSWGLLQDASPVFLRFEAHFWPLEIEKMPRPDKLRFGRNLQKRWLKVGILQLDPVMTQPMSLTLPKKGG